MELTQSRCPWPQSVSELTDFFLKRCCLALDVGLLLSFNIPFSLLSDDSALSISRMHPVTDDSLIILRPFMQTVCQLVPLSGLLSSVRGQCAEGRQQLHIHCEQVSLQV